MASIRSVGSQVASPNNVGTSENLAPTLPGTRVNGDLLLLFTSCRLGTPGVCATPSGWTSLANIVGTNGHIYVFGRKVDGAETAPTAAWSALTSGTSGGAVQAQIACVEGLNTSGTVAQAVDVTGTVGNQAASTTAASGGAAITTLTAGAVVFVFSSRQDDAGTWATLATSDTITWAKVAATFTSTSGLDTAQEWQWGTRATAGSVAAKTFALTGASSFASSGVMIAFKPRLPVTYFGVVARPITFGKAVAGQKVVLPRYTGLLDDFNRANGLVYVGEGAALWSDKEISTQTITQMQVLNGTLTPEVGVGGSDCISLFKLEAQSDLIVDVPITSINNRQIWFGIESEPGTAATGQMLMVDDDNGVWTFYTLVNGAVQGTPVNNPAGPILTAGGSIWIERTATTTTAYYKPTAGSYSPVLEISVTPTAGRVGLALADIGPAFENLRGGPLVAGPPGSYGAEVMADGPKLYYRLGDPVGSTRAFAYAGERGTYQGGATLGQPGAITDGDTAVAFDGVDDKVTIPSSLVIPGGSSITVEFWQYRTLADVKLDIAFILGDGSDDPNRCQAHVPYVDNSVYWDYGSGGGAGRITTFYGDHFDKWTLVHLTFDAATTKLAISLDGVEVASKTSAIAPALARVGGTFGGFVSSLFSKTVMDEFAVYDKALTPARRLAHYQARGAPPEPTTHYGASSLAATFGAATTGRRQTTSAVALPATFAAATQGRRKTFGVVARPSAFAAASIGQRRTFGVVARPTSFSAASVGQRRTFTSFVRPVTFGAAVAGTGYTPAVTHYGASSLQASFGAATVGRRTTRSAVVLPATFAAASIGQRKTFSGLAQSVAFGAAVAGHRLAVTHYGAVSVAASFGAATAGRRTAKGAVALPATFAAAIAARRRTFGAVARPSAFGAVTAGQRKTFGAVAVPAAFAAAVQGRRTVFASTVTPVTFGAVTAGQRVAVGNFGAVAASYSFGSATAGQRKTFGVVARPLALGVATVASRKTFGVVARPVTVGVSVAGLRKALGVVAVQAVFGAVTQGRRRTTSALAMPMSLTRDTKATRKTFGAVALPAAFGAAAIGRRGTFGAVALPMSLGRDTVGRRGTFGAILLPTVFGAATAGRKVGLTGIVGVAMTLARATQGQRRTFGQVARPVTLGAVTAARRRTFGQVARPITFAEVTAGQRKAFAKSALAVAFGEATTGQRKTFAKLAFPIVLGEAVSATREALGAIDLPLDFVVLTDGSRQTFAVVAVPLTFGAFTFISYEFTVLNDADAVFLGGEPVEAVYAGPVEVWSS